MPFRKLFVCLLLAFCLLLVGCGATAPNACDLADALSDLPLPPGTVYRSDAEPWERSYLPTAVGDVLLGAQTEADGSPVYRDFCVYLSADGETAAEIVIATCYTAAAAERLATRLALRLERLRREMGEEGLADAEVRLSGRSVLYLATPCNGAVLDAWRRA